MTNTELSDLMTTLGKCGFKIPEGTSNVHELILVLQSSEQYRGEGAAGDNGNPDDDVPSQPEDAAPIQMSTFGERPVTRSERACLAEQARLAKKFSVR